MYLCLTHTTYAESQPTFFLKMNECICLGVYTPSWTWDYSCAGITTESVDYKHSCMWKCNLCIEKLPYVRFTSVEKEAIEAYFHAYYSSDAVPSMFYIFS